ncbi:hypothetical protein HGM15179_013936 [Zosterops borbonicus]|uniref:Uncharacterized protein n=1 Tax=Zosterops borbonicus TaxID=364589 RepID=A0A8K1LGS1_9PASS|nr:hypothetical protein HGM15179_013936 [Zosterops borbonicus]
MLEKIMVAMDNRADSPGKGHGKLLGKLATNTTGDRITNTCVKNTENIEKKGKTQMASPEVSLATWLTQKVQPICPAPFGAVPFMGVLQDVDPDSTSDLEFDSVGFEADFDFSCDPAGSWL